MGDPYHIYRGRCEDVISADTLDVTVDLGFRTTKQTYISLFGVDAHNVNGVPDDSEEHRRGDSERDFVLDWITAAEMSYTGTDGYPLALLTLIDKTGSRQQYQAITYSRYSKENLTDEVLREFPEVSDL
jgi:hypothetical protein